MFAFPMELHFGNFHGLECPDVSWNAMFGGQMELNVGNCLRKECWRSN